MGKIKGNTMDMKLQRHMGKVNTPRKVGTALREILYNLSLKKTTEDKKYEMLTLYDDRFDITKPGDKWNIVDRTQCNAGVIHAAKIKAEARLRELL